MSSPLTFSAGEVIVIGAMAPNGVIGVDDGMPWNVPEEYQHFVNCVQGNCVIIGRRSWEIFGADFQARTFVVSTSASVQGATACNSFESALRQAQSTKKPVFIAGGKSIYEIGIPHAHRMLLSTIRGDFEGDTYFPEYDRAPWQLHREEDHHSYVLRDWRRGPS